MLLSVISLDANRAHNQPVRDGNRSQFKGYVHGTMGGLIETGGNGDCLSSSFMLSNGRLVNLDTRYVMPRNDD